METYAIRMTQQKASILGNLLRMKQSDSSLIQKSYFVHNTSASTVKRDQYVSITGFRNTAYTNCLRYVNGSNPVFTGIPSSVPLDYTALQSIRSGVDGEVNGPELKLASCNATNEIAAGGDWQYANHNLELVESESSASWRVIAKSAVDSTSTYKVCALAPLKATGTGGTPVTITFCDEVSLDSYGNLQFHFDTLTVLTPA